MLSFRDRVINVVLKFLSGILTVIHPVRLDVRRVPVETRRSAVSRRRR